MKTSIPTIACVFIALAMVGCGPPPPPELTDGDSAPVFTTTQSDGRAFQFPASTGSPSVLLVWATWCSYCKVLMPRLGKIRTDYVHLDIQIVAVNAKERGRGNPATFIRDAGYDFVTIVDGDDIAELYDVDYLPGLFVVDGEGMIVYRRKWTELSAGQEVADLWENQVRSTLDALAKDCTGCQAQADST